ncbi:hypothetical protein [Micromonospora tarapacensis]|nr:hypothetical protein [Micromonospora tarapacensis]
MTTRQVNLDFEVLTFEATRTRAERGQVQPAQVRGSEGALPG